jgi:molybdenum cofactor cytidylyltransferase
MIQKQPTAGIILAAGASTRFGQPKQLLRLKDKYLIERVLDAALASRLKQTILVLGHEHRKILQALENKIKHPRLAVVINKRYHEGQSISLIAGFLRIKDTYPSVMFLLGDQPMLNTETINRLLDKFWSCDKDICVPVYHGKRGNPTIFSNRFYHLIMHLRGDTGAREIIRAHPDCVLRMEVDDPHLFFDIDTQKDLASLEAYLTQS